MPERSRSNPNNGDYKVTEEGDVVSAETELDHQFMSRDDREDVGHEPILEKNPNPYWPNDDERQAAEKAKADRQTMGRKPPVQPWRDKLPKHDS